MKIAQVSLLHEGVAPWPSTNAARSMLYLIEALVGEGHEVTLFSSEEWKTSARNFDVVHFHCDSLNFDPALHTDVPGIATLHTPCDAPQAARAADIALIPIARRYLDVYRSVIHAYNSAAVTVGSIVESVSNGAAVKVVRNRHCR